MRKSFMTLLPLAGLLAACGGGGSSTTTTTTTTAPAPVPAATAPAAETAAMSASAPMGEPGMASGATAAAASGAVPAQPQVSQAAKDEADKIFTTRCAACHGTSGKGDGPAGQALPTHPADYTSATFQASVTDDEIEKAILQGGAAVGKSPLMPPNPDLASKPEIVTALRVKVRSFGQQH